MAMKLTRWQYCFLMHTCNLGETSRIATNPLTGKTVEFHVDDGLTDEEIEALQNVFDKNGIDGPEPDFEGYAVYGIDGGSLRFRCGDLDGDARKSGIQVEAIVKELSDEVLNIILEVARAGNLALTSSVGDFVRIVDQRADEKLLKRWPDARPLSSIGELRI